jgi:hypothetical protein
MLEGSQAPPTCLETINVKLEKLQFIDIIYKNSVHISQETHRVCYKAQPVNAV